MASTRQVLANRENGLKGGVKTEEGKAISRLNARKHSIFVTALTAEDSEEVQGYEDQLIASLRPAGRVEEMLVEKLALTWLRMQRCARAEAEYHSQTWEEPNEVWDAFQWEQLQRKRELGARGVPFKEEVFERMVKLIDLYDARLTNQFLKLLHEIERLQRLRRSEDAPPVVVANPDDQADASGVAQSRSSSRAVVCRVPAGASEQAPDGATTNAQARAPVPHTPLEQAPAPAFEQSQDAGGQDDNAQKAI